MTRALIPAIVMFACLARGAHAQQPASPDTLRLGDLQSLALSADPNNRALALMGEQSALRQKTLSAERLPALSVDGQAQYQSDVARLPVILPGGMQPPSPPNDTYDARLSATEVLFDPTLGARRAVERAQLAESRARVRAGLFPLRQGVSEAFFAALRAQEQQGEIAAAITDLAAQLDVAANRVREGAALPSEADLLRAELLRRRQSLDEADAERRAALEVLSDLAGGAAIDTAARLALPDMAGEVASARASLARGDLRARPEYEQFASSRELLDRQAQAREAQDLPHLSAFAKVGYGRPGLNPLNDTFDSYWLAGVQLRWAPWSWGSSRRDREVLAIQREIVAANEESFTRQTRRAVSRDVAAIERLETALAQDDSIVALRERIAAETRARFAESVVTSADYVDRQTDVLSARIARRVHRVELAQSRAHFLTTLGLEVR